MWKLKWKMNKEKWLALMAVGAALLILAMPADGGGISIGFVAHMDTSPDAPGTGVKPWVYENYPGGDVLLNKEQNILMRDVYKRQIERRKNNDFN